MPNAWMNHVKNFRRLNSKLSYREVLKQARKTYGGGVVGDTRSMVSKYASSVGGGPMTHKGGKRRSGTRRRRR